MLFEKIQQTESKIQVNSLVRNMESRNPCVKMFTSFLF
jgi:hypothetical protein